MHCRMHDFEMDFWHPLPQAVLQCLEQHSCFDLGAISSIFASSVFARPSQMRLLLGPWQHRRRFLRGASRVGLLPNNPHCWDLRAVPRC